MSDLRKVGRPLSDTKKEAMTFRIIDYLSCKLRTYSNQSEIVNKSLELYFSIEDRSDALIVKEIEEHQRIIASLEASRKHNKEQEIAKSQFEEDLRERYEEFTRYASHYSEGYNTNNVNRKYGIDLKDFKHFERIRKMISDGSWSIEEFKKINAKSNGRGSR